MARNDPENGMVFVVDDKKLDRHQLHLVLQSAGYSTQCFASGHELFQHGPPTLLSCLLLDVQLTGKWDGPSIHSEITRREWLLPVIYVTAHATIPLTVSAVKAGAVDVLTKPVERESLLSAVEKALSVARHNRHARREQSGVNTQLELLTEREQEVLRWVITGKLNKEVADVLGITERTVKAHRASIMSKLGVLSIVDLVRFADKAGIAPGRE